MEKEFIPYEQALALKELGYNRKCLGQFNTHQGDKWLFSIDLSGEGQYPSNSRACLAPTYSQSFRWFREKYKYMGIVLPFGYSLFDYRIYSSDKGEHLIGSTEYNTYEEAELECLKELIEIVKEKK